MRDCVVFEHTTQTKQRARKRVLSANYRAVGVPIVDNLCPPRKYKKHFPTSPRQKKSSLLASIIMISKVTRLFYSGTRRSSSIALRHSLRTFVSTPVTLHVANQAHHSEQPNLSPPQSRRPKEEGTIASVFATLSGGSLSDALPSRFLQLKKSLVMSPEHALALQQAWKEIIAALATQTREASLHGAGMIPQVHYPGDQTVERKPAEEWIGHDNMIALRERGTIILKNVVPASVALLWKQQIREYIEKNPQTKGVVFQKILGEP